MNRVRFAAATLMTTGLIMGVALAAQTPPAPDLHPILAGMKVTPPVRGEAQVEYTACPGTNVGCTKRDGNAVVTTVPVRNASSAPIARLAIEQTWYDKSGGVVTSTKGVINGLLQPGEVQTIRIETDYDPKMNGNQFVFTHANGTVKPAKVAKLDAPADAGKDAAAKPAPAAKKK
jgi:hypothetical protein